MFITIINLINGESKTGSLKAISKQTNLSQHKLRQLKREKVTMFSNFAISFNHSYIKQNRKGTATNLVYRPKNLNEIVIKD